MAKKIAIDVEVKAEGGAKSLKDLKGELKDLQAQISQTKEGSEEYLAVLRQIGDTKDQIDDLNESIAATTGAGRFQAIANIGTQIAAGFQLAQSAMALFGSESEEVQKALLKVQAAMGLVTALKELEGFGDAWKNFKMVAVDALKAIKTGLGATGIGLLVVALGTVVAYWDDIKEAVSGVNEEQKDLLETQTKSAEKSKENLDSISKQENILKLQGKTEKEILELKQIATKNAIIDLKAQLTTQEAMRDAQIETARRNRDILEGILKFLTAPISFLLKSIDKVGEVLGKDFGLEEGLYKNVAELVFDPEETEKNTDESIQKTKDALRDLENQQAGFQLSINKINEDAAAKSKEAREKKAEEDKKKDEELKARIARNNQLIKEQEDEEAQAFLDKKAAKEKAINDGLDKLRAAADEEIRINNEKNAKKEKDDAEREARQKLRVEAGVELTRQSLKLTADIVSAFAKEDEASQRKAFEINKKVQLALATIEMIKGVQSAFTSAQGSPFTAVFPGYPYVQAAMAAAYGLMNIRKISQTQFQGGGGAAGGMEGAAGGAGGAMSAPLQGGVNNTSTMLENLGQQQEQKPIKAYVLQTDVASEDQKIKAIENKSKIE